MNEVPLTFIKAQLYAVSTINPPTNATIYTMQHAVSARVKPLTRTPRIMRSLFLFTKCSLKIPGKEKRENHTTVESKSWKVKVYDCKGP